MKTCSLLYDWDFYRGIPDRFNKPVVEKVDLPHDFLISTPTDAQAPAAAASGFYRGGVGTYQKLFMVPPEWEGERVCLRFDGIYHNATISINGSKVGFHPYGFTPFVVDITHRVMFGCNNRLEIVVNADAVPNCRWYTGAGIYRTVELMHGPMCRIAPWGMYLRTEAFVDEDALVIAQVEIKNDLPLPVQRHVLVKLTDKQGKSTQAKSFVYVPSGESVTVHMRILVKEAKRWSVEDPQCYMAEAVLLDKEETADTEECRFGIRLITADAVHGLRINGRPIKLKGGCIHHVTSALGAADYLEQSLRVIKQHKAAGYNAIRCAHNPPSAQFLDICDELGMLVIDEAFDGWHISKTLHGYAAHFEDWWERDLEAMMRRDRNHPSVVFWSTGNEVYERAGCGEGYLWAQRLTAKVRSLDESRPVMHGLCSLWNGLDDNDMAAQKMNSKNPGSNLQNSDSSYTQSIWAERTEGIAAAVDVVGYNYLEDRYTSDHERFPERVICGTESFPMQIDKMWELVEKNVYVIGDFVWTSADYIGEAGIGCCVYEDPDSEDKPLEDHTLRKYPWRVANDADWDICGFERPQLAYRKIVWGSDETYIAVKNPATYGKREKISGWGWPAVFDSWNWQGYEGRPIQVDVYSSGDEVELKLNGISQGIEKTERYKASFELVYMPGKLEAVSLCGGKEVSCSSVETTGAAEKIVILPEYQEETASKYGLIYAQIQMQDSQGRLVKGRSGMLNAKVEGQGKLIAFASGEPQPVNSYTEGVFPAYDGRALAIIRAGDREGDIILSVSGDGFDETKYTFKIK